MTFSARMPLASLLLLFALQGIVGVLTLVQPFAAKRVPALFQTWAPVLVGVRASAPVVQPNVQSVLDGSFQRAAEVWVGDHLVQRPAVVRVFNEVLWQGFGTSYMAHRSIVRGLGATLYEEDYILAHCGISLATNIATLPSFARRLRVVQDWFNARGRHLVYYVAPVKTSWFPERIPASFPCPDKKQNIVRPSVLAAFHQAGVDFVDGPAALEARRGHFPVELFPRNGIHWNWLGTAIGVDALLEKLRELGIGAVPTLKYDISITNQESGTDRDLADLLNLLWPLPGDASPNVTVTPINSPGTLRLAAVNDSFLKYLPMVLLDAGHIFRSETVFNYLNLDQWYYENGTIAVIDRDTAEITRTLLDADVTVLEEVETRVGGPYALRFLAMMEAKMAGDRSGAARR